MRKIMINGSIEPTVSARSLDQDIRSETFRAKARKRQAREAARLEALKPQRWVTYIERSIPNGDKDE